MKDWCIMAEFQTFNCCYSPDMAQILQGLSYKVCFTMSPNFFAFGFSVIVFGMSAIIYQQLVAMSQEHVKLVYKAKILS